MKITGAWLRSQSAQRVLSLFACAGHQAFFVGGCVRDDQLGFKVSDIDIASDATPAQTINLAQNAGIQFRATGIDHGTVTLVVHKKSFEVTTFRKDISTDGRHAGVVFLDDIEEDARRRDFTMNALYADKNGVILDPLNGLKDLHEKRVRFIGDASTRIKEDYLRILRFFRFSAWYANPKFGFNPDTLNAVTKNLKGLKKLSRERVSAEIIKLLTAPNPAPSVATMRSTGVLGAVIAEAEDRLLPILIEYEKACNISPDPLRRLAAIGGHDLQENLRLNKQDTQRLKNLHDHMSSTVQAHELGYRLGEPIARSILLLRAAVFEQQISQNEIERIKMGSRAKFPVKGSDLINAYAGAALGRKLKELEIKWISSEFTLNKQDLLSK